jgi:putative acetyltransferase
MNIQYIKASPSNIQATLELYQKVAVTPGGLARTLPEITQEYVQNWAQRSLKTGLWIIAKDATGELIGSIHAYRLDPEVFSHVLSELTIAIHPNFQGKGVGRTLFKTFLNEVETYFPHILRVELIARESNQKAIQMYESLGFVREGKMLNRIKSVSSGYEADIPMGWVRQLTS